MSACLLGVGVGGIISVLLRNRGLFGWFRLRWENQVGKVGKGSFAFVGDLAGSHSNKDRSVQFLRRDHPFPHSNCF